MADGFCQGLLRISMAQICQELGWNSIHSTPCDLLTDVLQRYIQQLATVSHCYAEQYGRAEPNVDDLGLTFRQMGVSLYELENYIRDVDPIPFKHDIPQFPVRRNNDLQHPKPGSRDDRERLQYIPAHLPPIIGLSDDFGAPIGHHRDSISSVPGTPMDTDSTESRLMSPMGTSHTSPRGEKRDTSSPLFSDQAMKRLRLDGDGTPQELTAVSIGIGGELTPKREGKLPIATTPPQRMLKAALAGGDITPIRANKAITDALLNRSEETIVDRLQHKSPKGGKKTTAEPKSPKSAKPAVTPKQKAQTKSPIHMFSPSSKYPMMKSKTSGTPGAGDKAGEFQFPPPKSPKSSSSVSKKQQEKLQESAKKEKTVPSVYDFDDDEFDSKLSKDPTLSPSDTKGSFKDPLSLDADLELSKTHSQTSDSSNLGKGEGTARAKEDRDRSSSPHSENLLKSKKLDKDKKKSVSKDKSKLKHKLKNKKNKEDVQSYYDSVGSLDKKHTTPKAVKRKNSTSSEAKTPKLVIKTERRKSGDDEMRVIKKKFKKVKEKDKQKQLKVKKLKPKSFDYKMKSKPSKHGIAPSATKPEEDSSPEKRLPIGKLSLIKSAGSKLQFKIAIPPSEKKNFDKEKGRKSDKSKTSDKEKPKVKRPKLRLSEFELPDKEKKTSSKDKKKTSAPKDKKKESSKKDKDEVVSTPTVPKITFKLGAAPAGGDTPKIVIKTATATQTSVSTPTVPKLSIAVPSKKSKELFKSSKSVASPKTESKSKGESKTKTDSKPKADSKKEKVEVKLKSEAKPSKTSKKKEKEREKEVEKEKKVKEKPVKIKLDTKPKAEVSPYDFDAPSPPPTIKAKKESSTPARKEPLPGIFAPSVPSPPPSSKSSSATSRSSIKAAEKAPSSPAPQKSKQKASTPAPTPPPTKAALKALPPSATKASKASKQKEKEKEKEKVSQKQKAVPPPSDSEPESPKPKPEGPCILIAETAGTVVNEDGEQIWYCPECRRADDGVLPMVGCDTCDDWYHWECVGLTQEPATSNWYCTPCQNKSKGKKKKGRKN